MHVNLPCAIVEDLLPLYLDDLSSPETRACVEAHLAVCPVCAAKRDAMAAPEPERPEIREVDYLKKVRSRQRRRITAAVLFTILAGLLLLAGKLFFLGQPAQESNITVLSSEITEDQVLQLHLDDGAVTAGLGELGLLDQPWMAVDQGHAVGLHLLCSFHTNIRIKIGVANSRPRMIANLGETAPAP